MERPDNAVAEVRGKDDEVLGWLPAGQDLLFFAQVPSEPTTTTPITISSDDLALLAKYAGQRMVLLPFIENRPNPDHIVVAHAPPFDAVDDDGEGAGR